MKRSEVLGELGVSQTYTKPVGIMELIKFNEVATPELKMEMKALIAKRKWAKAWDLLERTTGVKLREAEIGTKASEQIYNSMRDQGYKLIGSGVDATVWAKKSGPVTKIIMPSNGKGAGASGDTFMKFYRYCQENPNLDNLPKFYGGDSAIFNVDGKDYIMATMERLTPIPEGSIEQALVWILSDFASKGVDPKMLWPALIDPKTWKWWDGPPSTEELISSIRRFTPKQKLEWGVIYRLMYVLWLKGKINKMGWDLHTENAMLRGNTVVIIDPWIAGAVDNG